MKRLNLESKTFGVLEVVGQARSIMDGGGTLKTMWLVHCKKCGTYLNRRTIDLTKLKNKRCKYCPKKV